MALPEHFQHIKWILTITQAARISLKLVCCFNSSPNTNQDPNLDHSRDPNSHHILRVEYSGHYDL